MEYMSKNVKWSICSDEWIVEYRSDELIVEYS